MKELESLQKQLAREDDLISETEGRIDSAREKIESLRQQIETTKREIQAAEQLIDELHANSETIKKRKALLLQYIELARSGNDTVPPDPKDASNSAQPSATAPPAAKQEKAETDQSAPLAGTPPNTDQLPLEADEDPDLDDLPYLEPLDEAAGDGDDEPTGTVSLDEIDEIAFTHEILPHTETFAEELLLVLAYHRKATAPKSVVRIFRRLDYAPKQAATEENVTALIELNPHHYQYAAGGRIALTREGRNEAHRLLEELT